MPYIRKTMREVGNFEAKARALASHHVNCAGDLNFAITVMIDQLLLEDGVKYAHVNEMIGVLECAKLELYRRVIGPYEDVKIEENTDVYKVLEE